MYIAGERGFLFLENGHSLCIIYVRSNFLKWCFLAVSNDAKNSHVKKIVSEVKSEQTRHCPAQLWVNQETKCWYNGKRK